MENKKEALIEERGSKCQNCGYKQHPQILKFVQVTPILSQRKSISKIIADSSLERGREASYNAMLVCANCAELYRLGYLDIGFKACEPPIIYTAIEVVDKDEPMNEYKDYKYVGVNPNQDYITGITSRGHWKRVWFSSDGKREAWANYDLKIWYKIES